MEDREEGKITIKKYIKGKTPSPLSTQKRNIKVEGERDIEGMKYGGKNETKQKIVHVFISYTSISKPYNKPQ